MVNVLPETSDHEVELASLSLVAEPSVMKSSAQLTVTGL